MQRDRYFCHFSDFLIERNKVAIRVSADRYFLDLGAVNNYWEQNYKKKYGTRLK
ncbi:MAG: hypothetical protein ACE5K2_07955 [Candidatus Zixiibacteriota bacterium]